MKTKLRILSVIALVVFFGGKTLVAQEPDFLFEHPYPYPVPDDFMTSGYLGEMPYTTSLEMGSGEGYLIAMSASINANLMETDTVARPPVVYKVSLEGNVVGELTLGHEGRFAFIYRLFDDPDDNECCLAVGFIHDNDLHYNRILLSKFDYDLNLLWQEEVEMPEPHQRYIGYPNFIDHSGRILFSGVDSDNGFYGYPKYALISTNGEVETVMDYPHLVDVYLSQSVAFEYNDGSGDFGFVVTEIDEDPLHDSIFLCRMNNDLELVGRRFIPSISDFNAYQYNMVLLSLSYATNCFSLSDGSVALIGDGYLSRENYQHEWDHNPVVGFFKLNQDGDIIAYASYGQGDFGYPNDSIKVSQATGDMVGDDNLYITYSLGQPNGTGIDYTNCFVVVRLDSEGNVIWKRYWDRYYPVYGKKVYWPYYATATEDEGCLLTGFCYHSEQADPEIFMLKFFADGSLSVPEMETFVRPYAFYPNPAQSELHFQYSPDVTPARIELYDLQGRLLQTQTQGLESIGLEGLAAGQYLMKVTLKDGKTFTDKVVKE